MKKWNSRKLVTWLISSAVVISVVTVALFQGKIDQYVFRDLFIAWMTFTLSYFVTNVWQKIKMNGVEISKQQKNS